MDKVDFDEFKERFGQHMVYKPAIVTDKVLWDFYMQFKQSEHWKVWDWCHALFDKPEIDLDSHGFMYKERAFDSKHVQGLIDLAKKWKPNV